AQYNTAVGTLTGRARDGLEVNMAAWLSVRPEHFTISRGPREGVAAFSGNHLVGTVTDSAFLGNLMDYRIDVGGRVRLRAQGSPGDVAAIGERVNLAFAAENAWPLPREDDGDRP